MCGRSCCERRTSATEGSHLTCGEGATSTALSLLDGLARLTVPVLPWTGSGPPLSSSGSAPAGCVLFSTVFDVASSASA